VPLTVPVSQSPTSITQNNPNVRVLVMCEPSASSDVVQVDKARTWWREHRQGMMGSLESVFYIGELVVVPPAQAAVGAAGAALKDLRVSP
jgi:hypothetical protein